MMAETNDTDTGARAWLTRVCALLLGVPVGTICSLAAMVILFWNEGRAVKTDLSLREGMKKVVGISADQVDPQREGQLVHVQGRSRLRVA